MPFPRRTLPSLSSCQQGLAYVEFALSLSFLMLLFLGSIEVTRYILILQKLEKTAQTVADVTAQTNPNTSPLTTNQMSQLMSAVQDMMNPYTFGANGRVIVTDITKTGTANPVVRWQYCGGGTLSATAAPSRIGTSIGGAATLPAGFTMTSGEEVIISEVFFTYQPITTTQWSIMSAATIYRTAIFMPRLGALTGFSSSC